jgi:DNA-binding LytR/AlgR family response regulator
MIYKCLIVDDEAPARKLLRDYVEKIPNLECVQTFSNAIETKLFLHETPIDILFLDIQMPDLTGLDLMKILPEPKPAIILTTAYSEYAVESYQFTVADYLLKPITFERFFKAVNKVTENHAKKTETEEGLFLPKAHDKEARPDYIFVKANQKIVKIDFDQILYLEGLREYVSILTTTGRQIVLQSLSRFLEILPPERFVRVHRSYIVNIERIDAIENNTIRIGSAEIVISKSQKQAFLNFINRDMLF